MVDVSFIVALIACEFPCLVIDKGRRTHSLAHTLHYGEQ